MRHMPTDIWRFTIEADDVEIIADFDSGNYEAHLIGTGVLNDDPALKRASRPANVRDASRSFTPTQQAAWPTSRQWLQIVRALVITHWRMRRPPRDWVLWFKHKAGARDWNEVRICQLVAAFHTAATLLPGLSRCLPRSMALLDFLASYGFRGRWVFAVRPVPFEAHCWVEWEDLVLTDHVDHTRWFTVFLVVD
jgi:hypothetical protein